MRNFQKKPTCVNIILLMFMVLPLIILSGCNKETAQTKVIPENIKGEVEEVLTYDEKQTIKEKQLSKEEEEKMEQIEKMNNEPKVDFGGGDGDQPGENYVKVYREGSQAHNAGQYDKAISLFSKSISMNGEYADAWGFRGISKMKSGNKSGACSDWQKAKSLGYANADNLIETHCK